MSRTEDFVIDSKGVLKEYKGNDELMEIPQGVKVIGKQILGYRTGTKVKKVIIPEGVTKIDADAFSGSYIQEVILPSTLQSIGDSAFSSTDNLKEIVIPEGVREICDRAFIFSKIEKVVLPQSLERIGNSAFSCCNYLCDINLLHTDTLEIGINAFEHCNKLAKEDGFLIVKDVLHVFDNKNSATDTLRIPDEIKEISDGAFSYSGIRHLEMNIRCPEWRTYGEARVYGFPRSVLEQDGSTITFKDNGTTVARVILANKDETEPKQGAMILSIRCKQEGGFDFEAYDNVFSVLAKTENKIRMALTRLQYPYELSDQMKEIYMAYIAKQSYKAGVYLMDEGDNDGIRLMMDMKLISDKSSDKLIEYSRDKNNTSVTAMLLEYDNNLRLEKKNAPAKKKDSAKGKEEKKVLDFKKPKPGSSLVSRYLGNDTEIVFPQEVDGVKITGIANTAGVTPQNYKNLVSVTLPEGYTYIGKKAFAGCENLERIILPSTIEEIASGAFEDCKNLKELVLRKGIYFSGNNTFSGAKIKTLVYETDKGHRVQPHLFFFSKIENMVVVGGDFKSNGNVFGYTGDYYIPYNEDKQELAFPEKFYTNHRFSTMDISKAGTDNVEKIHVLKEFDENIIMDEYARNLIIEEKKSDAKVVDNTKSIVEPDTVEAIDFVGSVFVLDGFDNSRFYHNADLIKDRGGEIRYDVSSTVNYLILPDRKNVINSKIRKALALKKKGKEIYIITANELRRNIFEYDKKIHGEQIANLGKTFRYSIQGKKIRLLEYIGDEEDVVIPSRANNYPVVTIGENCFSNYLLTGSSKLKSVVIPETVKTIENGAFKFCMSLKKVVLSEGLKTIKEEAFYDCQKLQDIVFPESLETIGKNAFALCSSLKNIHIGKNVKKIVTPFSDNSNL